MIETPTPSRRRFLQGSLAHLALAPIAFESAFGAEAKAKSRFEFCTFTKPLQHISFEEMAKTIAGMGFDGIEGAIRPGGHVEPDQVADGLPKLVSALKAENLNFTVMTSAINEVSAEQHTEKVLRTAADLGVKRFRMGYYKYDLNRPIRPQLDEFRPKLKDLVALASEIGIKPIYQNHSGKDYFAAPIWDLMEVLEDFSPEHVGVAFDIGHATVEGAKSWPLSFATAFPYIDTVYLKEPSWTDNQLGWGPLGEGAVDKGFYKLLLKSGFSGPVSVHVEYLGHNDPAMTPTILKAIEKDFATAKSFLEISA
jgi:sugar phosphate isomerase/epimerase